MTPAFGNDLLDATVTKRGESWWMVLAGQQGGQGATDLYSASLPIGVPLSANGWTPLMDSGGQLDPIGNHSAASPIRHTVYCQRVVTLSRNAEDLRLFVGRSKWRHFRIAKVEPKSYSGDADQ